MTVGWRRRCLGYGCSGSSRGYDHSGQHEFGAVAEDGFSPSARHGAAYPAAPAHTQSTAALATVPLVTIDLSAATAPCAPDEPALHFVPPRLVTVGAAASDVTPVHSVGSSTDSDIGPSPSHVAPRDAELVPCATPFATTATGLPATGPPRDHCGPLHCRLRLRPPFRRHVCLCVRPFRHMRVQ